MVGQDGYHLLSLVAQHRPELSTLEKLLILRQVWERHFETRKSSSSNAAPTKSGNAEGTTLESSQGGDTVVFRANNELSRAAGAIESPYETQTRHINKRDLTWTGYKVHISETCDPALPRLITQVHTTVATTQDVSRTEAVHQTLAHKDLLPGLHLVDAGYIDAQLLLESQTQYGTELFGSTCINPSWQARSGGYEQMDFVVDWEHERATCPQGKVSRWWNSYLDKDGQTLRVKVGFSPHDCTPCSQRAKCVRSSAGRARGLMMPPCQQCEALQQLRTQIDTPQGRRQYRRRAGMEGTLSQAVRRCDVRHAHYRGLAKTHLQHVATAVALNVIRTVNHLQQKPLASTRHSRFANLNSPTVSERLKERISKTKYRRF
jgi:transposase